MTLITLPKTSQTGTNEWADVEDNDIAIRDVVNGGLDNTNLAASAGIVDAKLASPNNSTYKTLLATHSPQMSSERGAATYILENLSVSGVQATVGILYLAAADYAVAGLTTKLRLRAQVATNAIAPTTTHTVGLYPVTVAGGIDATTVTLGTVVSGSTVVFAAPPASTVTQGNSGDLTIPADGAYVLGVVNNAAPTTNAALFFSAQLQVRNV